MRSLIIFMSTRHLNARSCDYIDSFVAMYCSRSISIQNWSKLSDFLCKFLGGQHELFQTDTFLTECIQRGHVITAELATHILELKPLKCCDHGFWANNAMSPHEKPCKFKKWRGAMPLPNPPQGDHTPLKIPRVYVLVPRCGKHHKFFFCGFLYGCVYCHQFVAIKATKLLLTPTRRVGVKKSLLPPTRLATDTTTLSMSTTATKALLAPT